MKKYLLIAVLLLSPLSAFAANTYHITCSDVVLNFTGGGASCGSDILTFTAGQSSRTRENIDLSNGGLGQTWYFSGTVTGMTDLISLQCTGDQDCIPTGTDLTEGANVAVPFVVPPSGSAQYQLFFNTPAGHGSSGGAISDWCITDTSGDCDAPPPPPPPPPSGGSSGSIVNVPSASDVIGSTSPTSIALFKSVGDSGILEYGIGITMGAIILLWLISVVYGSIQKPFRRTRR